MEALLYRSDHVRAKVGVLLLLAISEADLLAVPLSGPGEKHAQNVPFRGNHFFSQISNRKPDIILCYLVLVLTQLRARVLFLSLCSSRQSLATQQNNRETRQRRTNKRN